MSSNTTDDRKTLEQTLLSLGCLIGELKGQINTLAYKTTDLSVDIKELKAEIKHMKGSS